MRPLLLIAALGLAACADAPESPTLPAESADTPAEAAQAEAPTPGAQAPAFTLAATDGTEHSLADYRGRTVVL